VVLMTTGSQGEPTSALVRIANQEHRDVRITPGDTVIVSATPIPGNELPVSRTIDNLLRQGAKVLYDRVAPDSQPVHVHGHGSQEELKMVLNLVRPRYFVPVHGEYRHLVAHAQLAWDLGVAEDGIFVMEDGDVLEISPVSCTEYAAQIVEPVSTSPIFIDGLSTHDNRSAVLRERRTLSKDGVVVIVLPLNDYSGDQNTAHPERSAAESKDGDSKNKEPVIGQPGRTMSKADGAKVLPTLISSGFMNDAETGELFQALGGELQTVLADSWSNRPALGQTGLHDDQELAKSKVRETARDFIAKATGRRPMIIPVVL
jgi:mRNA degradation ribonuclease J1/J2